MDALTARVDYASGAVSATYHAQYDANWNITAIADATSGVLDRYIYDPYGTATVLYANWTVRGDSSYGWDYLHQGGQFDVDSNLYHFRHRHYSATLGRWTQTDPIGFDAGDTNLYRYEGNSPGNGVDPYGLAWWNPIDWLRGWREIRNKAANRRVVGQISQGAKTVRIDAGYEASIGTIEKGARNFESECLPLQGDLTQQEFDDRNNAARHAYWQGMLAAIYGPEEAKAIGDAHEYRAVDPLDSWIDLYNNEVARNIGLEVKQNLLNECHSVPRMSINLGFGFDRNLIIILIPLRNSAPPIAPSQLTHHT